MLAEVEENKLKETEQQFIEEMHSSYNQMNAKGWDTERIKESHKKASRKYRKTDKNKESQKKYYNQLCSYKGEILKLSALSTRFRRAGIKLPTQEAKKYLLNNSKDK